MTPAGRAAQALDRPELMCSLLEDAATRGAPHSWSIPGLTRARGHCGLIVGSVLIETTAADAYQCRIVITTGEWHVCGKHGGPASTEGAHDIIVWDRFGWIFPDVEHRLRPRILAILTEAAEHCHRQACAEQAAADRREREERDRQAALLDLAILKATGGAA